MGKNISFVTIRAAIGTNYIDDFENLDEVGYKMALSEHLKQANDFRGFKLRISSELNKMGFTDWSYTRADIPLKMAIETSISTFDQEKFKRYIADRMYLHDYAIEHAKAQKTPVYMADVAAHMRLSPVVTNTLLHNQKIVEVYKEHNFHDFITIPVYVDNQDNHAYFILAISGASSAALKGQINENKNRLNILIRLFDFMGTKTFQRQFIGAKMDHDKIMNDRSIRLLEIMAHKDFNISLGADALHMSRTAADKQLAKIRERLGVTTTHGALIEAIKKGLITTEK